jgi:hypothetical protein
LGYKIKLYRGSYRRALKKRNDEIIPWVECSGEQLYQHLLTTIPDGLSIENMKNYHIDHVIPLRAVLEDGNKPVTMEDILDRLLFVNMQYLTPQENMAKGNRVIN